MERQLQAELDELVRLAEPADHRKLPEQLDVPEELVRRENRLAAIRRVRQEIEARAHQRNEHERAEYEAQFAVRQARETGKKSRIRPP